MDYPLDEKKHQREEFMETWHRQEKMTEHIGGIALLFAAALLLALEGSLDQFALLAFAVFVAGGMTLLIRSRRSREMRLELQFLKYEKQTRNAGMAGMVAAAMFWFAGGRPLVYIAAVLLGLVALWFQWRGQKIRHLDSISQFNNKGDTH